MPFQFKKPLYMTIQLLLIVVSNIVLSNKALAFNITLETIDFSDFTGDGFSSAPSSGQLDNDDWAVTGLSDGDVAFGDVDKNTNDFARGISSGGENTGGIYSFDVGEGNRALGIQPTAGDFNPGTFTLKLTNDTGNTINDLDISYSVYIFNDENRSNSFNFSYSGDNSTYTSISSLNVTSTAGEAAAPAWVENSRSTTLSGVNIASNSDFYLRWSGEDVGGSGHRDEFALDDISFREEVPFDFSPSLGLLTIAGFGMVSYLKKRSQLNKQS
ncbi:MAG: hypothetical protein AAGE96_12570 [Cyanobacteria bacterium P01_G01_bin.19]